MIQVAKLAVELNIGFDAILYFLRSNGIENPTLNTKISDELERKFRLGPSSETRKSTPQIIDGFADNNFLDLNQVVSYKGKPSIYSHFSDNETITVCSKMSDGVIRCYAQEYTLEINKKHKAFLKYQLHYLAMKALSFYGGNILTFILSLKIFPGKNKSIQRLTVSKKRIYDADPTLPELEFYPIREGEKYYIRFSRKIERKSSPIAITVFNKRRKPLYAANIKGELITNFENRSPNITLFREYINGEKIMYSGFDNVYCDICGRELTDELSVMYGRGPSCRDNYPL